MPLATKPPFFSLPSLSWLALTETKTVIFHFKSNAFLCVKCEYLELIDN